MLSHIHIGTRDLPRAIAFYDAVLAPLGLRCKFVDEARGWAGWIGQHDRPLFLVGKPQNEKPHNAGNGQMVALLASSRKAVDLCHKATIEAGGKCEGPPGLRPEYHATYYGAYFRDMDDNKVCVCCHDEE